MRLRKSLASATEELIRLLNEGYLVIEEARKDYHHRQGSGDFDAEREKRTYGQWAQAWGQRVVTALNATFPSSLEANYFVTQQTGILVSKANIPFDCGPLITLLPDYIERLRHILDSDLRHYTDLPIQDRLYVEDIDSFQKVRDVNPAMVRHLVTNGYLASSEDEVQTALEQILEVPFHRKDWGGEINDLYTANVVVNGARRATAFLLKGPGIGKKVMEIADCGKRGDQIVRLFDTPADLFVIQYVGPIADLLIKDVQGKAANLRARGRDANFLIMDAQDTARVLHAYGKL
jgi:hypothetical protein